MGHTPVVAIQPGRTSFDVTAEPMKAQLETFLDEHRAALRGCLDDLTEEQARRRLVPSETTLLGLVKHATYAERVWFGEAVTGRPRQEIGLPPNAADAFALTAAGTRRRARTLAGPPRAWTWTTCSAATGWDRSRCAGSTCTPCASSRSTA